MRTEPLYVPDHRYRGARAMIVLHERMMDEFAEVWREADAAYVRLPETDDRDYADMLHLMRHVFGACRSYMVWMCEKLGLPDPGIEPVPRDATPADLIRDYIPMLLDKWRTPLTGIPEERFHETFPPRRGVNYCIDAMLEHAVVHPIRHTFQLRELIARLKA